ncbi:hypothetical protein TNCV_4243041 [Trichonephila clavipes]|nr:hypothetical protein TNCV_4243041 [Trichonephila clavipes]
MSRTHFLRRYVCKILDHYLDIHQKRTFPAPGILGEDPAMVREIDGSPEYLAKLREFLESDIKFGLPVSRPFRNQVSIPVVFKPSQLTEPLGHGGAFVEPLELETFSVEPLELETFSVEPHISKIYMKIILEAHQHAIGNFL